MLRYLQIRISDFIAPDYIAKFKMKFKTFAAYVFQVDTRFF
jgi:hypothetical protein